MKITYGNAFAVCIIGSLIAGIIYFIGDTYRTLNILSDASKISIIGGADEPTMDFVFRDSFSLYSFDPVMIVLSLISIIYTIFVANPIGVGSARFFFYNSKSPAPVSVIFSVFSKKSYFNIVKTMLLYSLIIVGGILLCLIPGIVFMYMFRMVPFILAENPNISPTKALKLSYEMTKGQKLNIFVLDLSFLGWYFLGLIACCIGLIFVIPYPAATDAELYGALRLNAAKIGICSKGEIGDEYFL